MSKSNHYQKRETVRLIKKLNILNLLKYNSLEELANIFSLGKQTIRNLEIAQREYNAELEEKVFPEIDEFELLKDISLNSWKDNSNRTYIKQMKHAI